MINQIGNLDVIFLSIKKWLKMTWPNLLTSIRNRVKTDALIKSGHRANDADKHDVNDVSGHISGHFIFTF